MGTISVEFDATGSAVGGGNPDGTAYQLSSANGYSLLSFEAPSPEDEIQWASSADTDGALVANQHPQNRTITMRFRLAKSSDALLESEMNSLSKKIGKFKREAGTVKFTMPSGTVCYADVLAASHGFTWDLRMLRVQRAEVTISLVCGPYLRGAETELGSDTVETTLPYLVKTVTGPAGDVPALGRLLIDNDQATNQWWMTWGLESQYYSSSANAALFYEAEGRTAQSSSATTAGPSGASGGGSNVMRQTSLQTGYQAILSTQASGGGAHLSHIGTFRVYARVQTPTSNSGNVTVALEWAEGDFLAYTRNDETTLTAADAEGKWFLVDLGLVTPRKVVAGTQRWEGRILARSSSAGDDIDVDYLLFVPVAEGSGIVKGVLRYETPTTFSGRDEFNQTAGNLSGKTATTGGNWVTAGSATDLAVTGSGAVTRSAGADTIGAGRLGTLDLNMTSTAVQVDTTTTGVGAAIALGVIARYVDSSNYLRAYWRNTSLVVDKVIAGSTTQLAAAAISTPSANTAYRIRLTVDTSGRWWVWLDSASSVIASSPIASGLDTVLATGGTLATGDAGIYDNGSNSTTETRTYDNFAAWVPTFDAAAYASQSLEVRHDRVVREDSGGTLWVKPSSYTGDYLTIPPTGQEARSVRVIVKFSRTDPFTDGDPSIDDLSARLFATPRFLAMPD